MDNEASIQWMRSEMRPSMVFFFVRDYKQKYRYFSSEPMAQIEIKFSRWKEIWERAKEKLMLLPQRILRQEQAFERILKVEDSPIQILFSDRLENRKIRNKFFFFLQKQRSKHILYLVGETLLLPLSGLAALLPGPNVFFGLLAILMITHWKALKGINLTLKRDYRFVSSSLIGEWEGAVSLKKEEAYSQILERMSQEFQLKDLHKVLWK
jgi:hypothetical protein